MTGQTWVTSTNAAAGYTAAINYINTNGVAVIGDGPFYITQYSASTSPAFMVLKQNPGFQAGNIANPNALAQAVVLTPKATIPPTLSSGGSFTVTVLQTPDGAPSTQATPANNATVVVQLVLNGATMFSKTLQTGSTGAVTVTLPTTLPAGTYQVSIYAQSVTSKLITPVVQSLTLSSAASSSSQQASSSMATSSSSTGTSSSTYTLIAAVVVIVIVIAGLGLYMMRRGKTPSS